ncbi:unnamed protein product [Boreogadus saida]
MVVVSAKVVFPPPILLLATSREPACALSSGLQAPQLLLSSERSPLLQLGRGLTVYLPRSPATGCLLRINHAGTPL